MILALDVGNTNICIGCFNEGKILFTGRMSTDHSKTADEYAIGFNSIIRLYGYHTGDVVGSIISSVVALTLSILPYRDAFAPVPARS